jgi:hypothetical protein
MTGEEDEINFKEKSPSGSSRIQLRKDMSLTLPFTKESEEDNGSQNMVYDTFFP